MDNLRSLIIVMVILLHTSLCYMAYAPEWWYVLDPDRSLIFTCIVLLTDVFIMPAMFFISGYFTFSSLRRKGTAQFVRDKGWRIAIPWVMGVLLLAPPLAYMIYFSRSIPVSFLDFWAGDFWGKAYQQAHYWFLGVLLGFVAVVAMVARLFPTLLEKPEKGRMPGVLFHTGFIALTTVLFLAADQFFRLDAWIHPGYVFVFQPVRIAGLFLYFLLGIYCEQNRWFTNGGYNPKALPWTLVCLASGTLYLAWKLIFPEPKLTTLMLQGINSILFNTFCLSSIMSLLAICKSRMNMTGPFLKHFSANSYGSYYVHQFFIFGTAYGLTKSDLPLFLKFLLTMAVAVILSWATSSLMKRTPLLKRMF
ncbi:MAG: acyltransferase [Desulfobacteraceae bacterium]|nr:acyltransferase [Desulfobacteraceae bacterium]